MSNSPSSTNHTRSVSKHLTLSVGPGGELDGADDRVLQAGVDYLHRLGGGVLQVLPGVYDMGNALFLHPGIVVRGSGDETILRKRESGMAKLLRDSDWYENCLTVEDSGPFHPGCGIMLRSYTDDGGIKECVSDTVVAVDGSELTLTKPLGKNFWVEHSASAATLYPIVTAAEQVSDAAVEEIVLDGNGDNNEEINGNFSGAVFIQQVHRIRFRHVTAQNYRGDGFSFQICDDIHFEECRAINNTNFGFHPGSGSQRPTFAKCVARGNRQGIFFCWGVSEGRVEGCECSRNTDYGISIGHRDTDNLIIETTFEENHKVGLLFRDQDDWRGAHRNLIERCCFRDNGFDDEGVAVDIRGSTRDVEIRDCCFIDSGKGRQCTAIRLGANTAGTRLDGNSFDGILEEVVDLAHSEC